MKDNTTFKIYRDGKLDTLATYKRIILPTTARLIHNTVYRLQEIGSNTKELIEENRL